MSKIISNADHILVKCESTDYESKSGVVANNLQKGGTGLKGKVLIPNQWGIEVGSDVEFQRNMGIQIRENIYSVKHENILLIGDLDNFLNKEK